MFGKIGAAFGAGFILGPAIGGLLGDIDPRLPFWVGGGPRPCQHALRPVRAAGIIAAVIAARRCAGAAPIRSARCICCVRTGFSQACRSRTSFAQLAHVVLPSTFVLYASYPLWLGHDDRRPDAGDGRRLRDGGAGGGDRADRATRSANAGRCCSVLAAARLGFLIFGARADRPAVLARHSRDGVVGRLRCGDPGADDASCHARTAGPVAGRDRERAERVAAGGTVPVHTDVCLFHRRASPGETAGRAVPAGRGIAAVGAADRGTDAGGEKTSNSSWPGQARPCIGTLLAYFFTSGHSLAESGLAASSGAIVAICL